MENITIRPAGISDIPVLLDLLYQLGRPKPRDDFELDSFRNLVKNYVTNSDKMIFVATLNDVEIIGMVSIVLLPRLNNSSLEMYIPELIVIENFQNHGIGKKIMKHCIQFAKEKKCHRIRLESGIQRKNSHDFYKNLEFEQSSLSFSKTI